MSNCPGIVSYAHGVDHCPACVENAQLRAHMAELRETHANDVACFEQERHDLRAQLAEAVRRADAFESVADSHLARVKQLDAQLAQRALTKEEREIVERYLAQRTHAAALQRKRNDIGARLRALCEEWENIGEASETHARRVRALLADLPDAPREKP